MPPAEKLSRKRSDEVAAAALRVFHRQGYASSSVGDIAQELGILKGSLYYYINSKEDLLFAICDQVHRDVSRILEEALASEQKSPLDRFAAYVRAQTIYNAENVELITVYYRDLERLSEQRLNDIRKRQRAHVSMLADLIAEGQKQGEIYADVAPGIAVRTVLSTIIWIYTWYRPKGKAKPEEIADFTVRYALHGLSAAVGSVGPGAS